MVPTGTPQSGRVVTLAWATVLVSALVGHDGEAASHARVDMRESWAATMLATRASVRAHDEWRVSESARLKLGELRIGRWRRLVVAERGGPANFDSFAWDPGIETHVTEHERILANATFHHGRAFRPTSWPNGTSRFARERVHNRKCAVYWERTIEGKAARELTLYVGFSGGMKVWINGQPVFAENHSPRRCQPNQAKVTLPLEAGDNHLLLKLTDGYRKPHGGHAYYCFLPHPVRFHGVQLPGMLATRFPQETDWLLQDLGRDPEGWLRERGEAKVVNGMLTKVFDEMGSPSKPLRERTAALTAAGKGTDASEWLDLYLDACRARREQRLARLAHDYPDIVYVRRHPVSPSFFAYTEGQSDAQHERHFRPGSALCVLHVRGDGTVQSRTLLDSAKGAIRDVDVSYDGKRLLFAWKKSDRKDDYHLYEMVAEGGRPRQLTFGLGFADYEPAYLPNGDIVFSSSRCVQTVDCWWTEVSNLYLCDGRGKYLRRVGFDQVHTICPHVLDDGTVIYTRWDYNDRGQIFPQGLFRMNADGTEQTEFYGNNSYFPTTISHARGIPGTTRVLAVAMGHHTWQAGKLIEIDTEKGRQEAEGIEMLAPRRPADPVRVDAYGQSGDLFRHPYPLSEREYLTGFVPGALNRGRSSKFRLYWMDEDGRRELLASDPAISIDHPIPLKPRRRPHLPPSVVDYRKAMGAYYMQDIYRGPGLKGIPRGTVKKLRVVGLEFRAAGVHSNGNRGPAGGALVSTPVSINNGSWDVKKVIGDATVYPDGSAFFTAPARTPLYFQALDAKGHAVQTMRSWSTLQPGETFSCVGCHESKSDAPISTHPVSTAMRSGAERLQPFYGPPRGFSFTKEVQPILDRHCVSCHTGTADAQGGVKMSASYCCPRDSAPAMWDGALPKNSDDHTIRRFTWGAHKGRKEWAQGDFEKQRKVGATRVYWFDDRPRGGGCRVPQSWRLLFRDGDSWKEVQGATSYGVEQNTFNAVTFEPVTTSALRIEVQLLPRYSSGVLEWQVAEDEAEFTKASRPLLNLTGKPARSSGGRAWTEAYLSLTKSGRGSEWVNWISAQSVPSMLPPYHKGAAKSQLLAHLERGHKDVRLTREELDKIACWVDLLVPFCGDYLEANTWSDADVAKYQHFQRKRDRMELIEHRHLEALVRKQTGEPFRFDEGYTNVALNPLAGQPDGPAFPRASSNSECRGEACFAAANVIDGRTENRGHGREFPSWGPDKREDLWLKIEFGDRVVIDRIDLYIRADFPHDRHWNQATLEFPDGSREDLRTEKTADRQTFRFAERTVEWIRFADLKQENPLGWCAFSEVEVWGRRGRRGGGR